jgi:RimJ/RimL family protein N-acetyltransferase
VIRTERLILRAWRESDKPAFAAMSADPRVMDWLGGTMSREQADAMADHAIARIAERGWGVWAVEVVGGPDFIGWTGLSPPGPGHPMEGTVEVGWRLARDAWGRGYATEGAKAALAYGFETLGLKEIVSFTARTNLRSQAVMRRIGMTHRPERDFDHPREDLGALRPHVVYAIAAP